MDAGIFRQELHQGVLRHGFADVATPDTGEIVDPLPDLVKDTLIIGIVLLLRFFNIANSVELRILIFVAIIRVVAKVLDARDFDDTSLELVISLVNGSTYKMAEE